MLLGLDHLVVAVVSPEVAAAELERVVGLVCTGGGRHPLWGTHNRLAWLGDTYVELIAVFDPSLTARGAVSRAVAKALALAGGQDAGLVTYAVASDDAASDVAVLRAGGSALADLESRSRTRPDGEVVRWRAAFPPVLGPGEPPFLIDHELVGAEWGDAARAARASQVHPVGGAARVSAIELPCPDVAAVAARYGSTLGIGIDPASGHGAVGDQEIRLVSSASADPAVVEVTIRASTIPEPRSVEAVGVRWRIVPSPAASAQR